MSLGNHAKTTPVRIAREAAFTFVEMLVVIVILAVIASIGFPSYKNMKAQASSTQCLGRLRDIGIALNTYMGEHGTRFPELASARESREDETVPTIDTALKEYLPDAYAFACPADHGLGPDSIWKQTGSSYFWNSLINGQRLGNLDLLGIIRAESGIPVVADKENFHEGVGEEVNVLYADGHVVRGLQFVVGGNK